MNFSADSVKHKSKSKNEDFYFDINTAHGHFFAVLDFGSHDYSNLNATLRSKLETIVGSFASLESFSADLFLGFLAKEINNFLTNLSEQGGGPELLASAVLSLVSENRLYYFVCGDSQIRCLSGGEVTSLSSLESVPGEITQLGARPLDTPATDSVKTLTLQDDDVVLIMSHGLAAVLTEPRLKQEFASLPLSEPTLVCEALMKAGEAASDDRTMVVIGGPFRPQVGSGLVDLSNAVTSLGTRLDAIEAQLRGTAGPTSETEFAQQIDVLKDDLRGKAAKIDLFELNENLKKTNVALAGKADSAAVLSLREELKQRPSKQTSDTSEDTSTKVPARSGITAAAALLVFIIALAGAFLGSWLQARFMKGTSTPAVASNAATPSPQVTSTPNLANQSPAVPEPSASPASQLSEITIKPGDSLKKLAQRYNVPPEKLMELNPTITKWARVKIGERIVVPAEPLPTPSPQTEASASNQTTSGTTEITVGPGDSINRLSQRYNSTPERLKELNPQITNWAAIHVGQKIVVPAPPAG